MDDQKKEHPSYSLTAVKRCFAAVVNRRKRKRDGKEWECGQGGRKRKKCKPSFLETLL
jgi:hypothetical protein